MKIIKNIPILDKFSLNSGYPILFSSYCCVKFLDNQMSQ